MFIFASLTSVATWFAIRAVHDLLLPAHRDDPATAGRRFWTITLVAALVVASGFALLFAAVFSPGAGVGAALVVAPAYVVLVTFLRLLLRAWTAGEPESAEATAFGGRPHGKKLPLSVDPGEGNHVVASDPRRATR